MNIIVQFKQNDFVLFATIDKKGIIWVESRTERQFLDYLVLHPGGIVITGNEKRKILRKLERNENVKLCMNRKYPVEIPQMSRNLKYYNVFKIQSK